MAESSEPGGTTVDLLLGATGTAMGVATGVDGAVFTGVVAIVLVTLTLAKSADWSTSSVIADENVFRIEAGSAFATVPCFKSGVWEEGPACCSKTSLKLEVVSSLGGGFGLLSRVGIKEITGLEDVVPDDAFI